MPYAPHIQECLGDYIRAMGRKFNPGLVFDLRDDKISIVLEREKFATFLFKNGRCASIGEEQFGNLASQLRQEMLTAAGIGRDFLENV